MGLEKKVEELRMTQKFQVVGNVSTVLMPHCQLVSEYLFSSSHSVLCFCFPAINGFLFSNLPKLDMCKGDTVAWHLLGPGTETDVHGVTFQGNTVQLQGMRKSSVMLFPHTFVMAIMQPDNPGKCLSS